jgi:cell division inhibitor SepF
VQVVGEESGAHARPSRSSGSRVSTSPVGAEPATVRPRRFDQAQELADKFKAGLPVILNLESTERDVARRLIDFASGVCYSLDGSMEKVATGVYLLKPAPQRAHQFDDYDS